MALVVNVPLPVPPSPTAILADKPDTVPPVKLATKVAIENPVPVTLTVEVRLS